MKFNYKNFFKITSFREVLLFSKVSETTKSSGSGALLNLAKSYRILGLGTSN